MPALDKKHINAGRSILEILWEELDRIMDILMTEEGPEGYGVPDSWDDEGDVYSSSDRVGFTEQWKAYGETRGQAQGVAYAIAVVLNPYKVDVPAVKREAMERWETANAE